jgi:hypothetical protein
MKDEVSATCRVPHAVVFIYDPALIVDIPEDTGAGPVLSTSSCIALWTADEESGPVALSISTAAPQECLEPVFRGEVLTAGRLAFNRSDCTPIIEVPVTAGAVGLTIYADDATHPSQIRCVVDAKATGS